MKKSIAIISTGLLLLGLLSGCLSLKLYVDSQLPSVSYEDLNTNHKSSSLGVLVEWQRGGKPYPPLSEQARETVLKVLNKTNLFSSVSRGVVGTKMHMKIEVNNIVGEGTGSGEVTGLTFGAIGSKSVDHLITAVVFEVDGSQPITKEYQQTIHGIVGNKKGPEGLKPMTDKEAIDTVIEQVVLVTLYELQQAGIL